MKYIASLMSAIAVVTAPLPRLTRECRHTEEVSSEGCFAKLILANAVGITEDFCHR